MKRQIVLDTETTGKKADDGHKIVEIGAVELINGKKTGKVFHKYINPQRSIPQEAIDIHGITDEKVKGEPTFEQVADEFLTFIKDAELLIHMAKFDLDFLKAELLNANKPNIFEYATNAFCTVELSRKLFAKERSHTLDSLCERMGVNSDHRKFHGALLDADLLADAYVNILGRFSLDQLEADLEQTDWVRPPVKKMSGVKLSLAKLTEDEEKNHISFLQDMEKTEKIKTVYLNSSSKLKP